MLTLLWRNSPSPEQLPCTCLLLFWLMTMQSALWGPFINDNSQHSIQMDSGGRLSPRRLLRNGVCPGILPWPPGKAASPRQAGLSSPTRGAATCQGDKSTWSQGALQHRPGLGPQSGTAGHQVAGTPSAVFMSSLFHVELHLVEKGLWSVHEVPDCPLMEDSGRDGR